ncbi:sodium- and chloride-dependent neutral and basic amino acid transporter B(0+)-like [Pagrus major]|uniref:sodium- and chloride-dependent neutral and basic amino acid transporter B(0+)-like n=1 Tax=Pagrus major TaxID=143350 RepID=UPI003CC8DBDC
MLKYGSNISKDPAIVTDQNTHVKEGDENPNRGNWTNKTEYMLTLVGYAIGLGNIWRFPYLAYKNGGGVFLIPYFLMLVLCGIPLVALESAIGQFCSQGPVNMWRAVPLMQGVGLSVVVGSTLLAIYYNVIIAYSLYYMFASFQFPLPWSSCFSWAESNCSNTPTVYCNVSGIVVSNWTLENRTCPSSDMITVPMQSPSEQYWDHVALQRSSGLDDTGPVVWHLALCLLLTAMFSAVALIRGIKSSGKVVYFTATFPYVILLILLIRGVTLEGARDGIEFFIGSQSNMTKLMEAQVWRDAAAQTFFTLCISLGGLVTLSSYNNFHNNMFLDTIVISLVNHVTSVFAGIAIFSILGHMAYLYGKPIGAVVKEGFGLAFIAYPEALSKLPISTLWSILFFLMMFLVGLDSQFTILEVIITCLYDAIPGTFRSKRSLLTISTCAIIYLLGLPCVTRAGIYWVTLLDTFTANIAPLVLSLIEVIGFIYIYGGNHLIKDIEMMLGKKSFCWWLYWRVCWFVISPGITMVILVWSCKSFVPPTYGEIKYPVWGEALGWCILTFIFIWIPVVAVYKLMRAEGSPWKRLKSLCLPSEEWHPFLDIHRGERYSEERCRRRRAASTNDSKCESKF